MQRLTIVNRNRCAAAWVAADAPSSRRAGIGFPGRRPVPVAGEGMRYGFSRWSFSGRNVLTGACPIFFQCRRPAFVERVFGRGDSCGHAWDRSHEAAAVQASGRNRAWSIQTWYNCGSTFVGLYFGGQTCPSRSGHFCPVGLVNGGRTGVVTFSGSKFARVAQVGRFSPMAYAGDTPLRSKTAGRPRTQTINTRKPFTAVLLRQLL